MTLVKRVPRSCLLALAILVSRSHPALAQTPRANGPFTGLFGGVSQSVQSLNLRGSLYGAYQDVFLPEDAPPIDPALDESGAFHGASAALTYSYNRGSGPSNLFFGGQGTISRISKRPDQFPYTLSANTGVSTLLSRRVTFSANGRASYSPYYGFPSFEEGFTPSSGFAQDPSLVGQPGFRGVRFEPTLQYGAGAGITTELTDVTRLTARADWYETKLIDRPGNDTRTYLVGARINHDINRYIGVHAGYTREISESDFPGSPRAVSNNIDLGIDANYAGNLPLSPSTTIGFGASTSILSSGDNTHFRVNGFGNITHQIGRTWSTMAEYVRDAGYELGFNDIVLSDRARASLSGLLVWRLSSRSDATWERGEVGIDSGQTYQTYSARTGLTFGLTSILGLYAEYSYFYYTVPPEVVTLAIWERYSRQIISGGITARLPIFDSGRRIRDSR